VHLANYLLAILHAPSGLKVDVIEAEESKKWLLPLGIDPSNDHHLRCMSPGRSLSSFRSFKVAIASWRKTNLRWTVARRA
jgi:hypothetical protein